MRKKFNFRKYTAIVMVAVAALNSGCEKYLVNTEFPANTIDGSSVYESDYTTSAVLTSVLITMSESGPFNFTAGGNFSFTSGLYTDELKSLKVGEFPDMYYKNAIQSGESPHWSALYSKVFVINAAIEGIEESKANLVNRNQWLGEAYFLRAFSYFYLTNIYGDVPLALTTDFRKNNTLSRAPQSAVYQQIISDLKQAQTLLGDDYRDGYGAPSNNRVRPNKAVATALLARVYLYTKDWANAEAQATEVISDAKYKLVLLEQVFLTSSAETIMALAPNSPQVAPGYNFYNKGMPVEIRSTQNPASFGVFAELSEWMLNKFEANDARYSSWVRSSTVLESATAPARTYYFPNKYKSSANNAEYDVLFRLAEQYLIRAEARAMQNKDGAAADLNAVRTRAGLSNATATGQQELLDAITKERQTELFTEGGHRFFDLKRTGTIDAVMNIVAPTKPTTWQSYMALWPLPPSDLAQNPNLTPNPGYLK